MSEDSISDDEIDALYRQMIDSFIDRANELAEQNSPENVGMALLFAASRFNSFVVSQHAENLEGYQTDIARAKTFFTAQYEEMLDENLEDYKQAFDKYAKFIKNH
jgi:hypothetical protein